MKQFSLEEYLADPSKKVVTRDGKDVRIICTEARGLYPVVALIERPGGDAEDLSQFTKDGCWSIHDPASSINLFFASKKKEGWANVYKHEWGYGLGNMFNDKKTAEASIHGKYIDGGDYIATVKIEWEE